MEDAPQVEGVGPTAVPEQPEASSPADAAVNPESEQPEVSSPADSLAQPEQSESNSPADLPAHPEQPEQPAAKPPADYAARRNASSPTGSPAQAQSDSGESTTEARQMPPSHKRQKTHGTTPTRQSNRRSSRYSYTKGLPKDKMEYPRSRSPKTPSKRDSPDVSEAHLRVLLAALQLSIPEKHETVVENYISRWSHLSSLLGSDSKPTPEFTFRQIPWPSLDLITTPEHLTTSTMQSFYTLSHGQLSVKRELLYWHTDKSNRLLPWILECDREAVALGISSVTQYLVASLSSSVE